MHSRFHMRRFWSDIQFFHHMLHTTTIFSYVYTLLVFMVFVISWKYCSLALLTEVFKLCCKVSICFSLFNFKRSVKFSIDLLLEFSRNLSLKVSPNLLLNESLKISIYLSLKASLNISLKDLWLCLYRYL